MINNGQVSGQGCASTTAVIQRASRGLALALLLCAALSAQTNTYPWPSSGNVGIGTTSPGYPLSVAGNANINGTLSVGSNPNVNFQSDGNSGYYIVSPIGSFYFALGGTYKAVLNTNGLSINNGSTGAGLGADSGVGHGMSADPGEFSGGRAADDGGTVVPAGISVRIRGYGEQRVRAGPGAAGLDGRGGAAGFVICRGLGRSRQEQNSVHHGAF